jgi:hypothetical protein
MENSLVVVIVSDYITMGRKKEEGKGEGRCKERPKGLLREQVLGVVSKDGRLT